MIDATDHLALSCRLLSRTRKQVSHNEALLRLDVLAQLAVISATVYSPAAEPDVEDSYLVPAGAGGEWASAQERGVVAIVVGAWQIIASKQGWRALDRETVRLLDLVLWVERFWPASPTGWM